MTVKDVVLITNKRETVWQHMWPGTMLRDLWIYRHLVWQLAVRDLAGRYKGSSLGLLWLIVSPLLMLGVYTFIFSVVFKSHWGVAESDSRFGFALTMFGGLIAFNVFAESVNRAPLVIVGNVNYVKKVVFPLQALPAAMVTSSLLLAGVSTGILLTAVALLFHTMSVSVLCFPLVMLPVVLLSLGLNWFLASLGVYLRDVGQVVGVLTQILFYSTPIFYPISAVPNPYRAVLQLNPLTLIVENARAVLLWGRWPDWAWLGGITVVCGLIAQLGYAWFMKTRKGFADVI